MMIDKIKNQLKEIQQLKEYKEIQNSKISKENIGWHLDHSLMVISKSVLHLKNSNPKNYKPHLSFPKILVFATGTIPRYKAKAPEIALPENKNHLENITKNLEICYLNLEEISNLDKKSHINHPIFGHLNVIKTMRFLEIHTQHHLKIIKDLLKNN